MDKGNIVKEGTPSDIFADRELLRSIRMDIPPVTELGFALKEKGLIGKSPVLSKDELISLLMKESRNNFSPASVYAEPKPVLPEKSMTIEPPEEIVLQVRDIGYTYSKGTANETKVLKGVSLDVHRGECIGLIGTSGAGKTTLLKHLNGLLKAESGDVIFKGESIYRKGYRLSELRKSVGLVFQSAENQLFCKTVLEDVKFGPIRMGMTEERSLEAAQESLKLVDIDEEYYDVSPQDLSGGQKRRVAIAGILAMEPEVLILDEPAAGLDPGMKEEIFSIIDSIRRKRGISVIIVSHEMEDMVRFADRVMIMSGGVIALEGTPKEVFSQVGKVRELGADVPEAADIMDELMKSGFPAMKMQVDAESVAREIAAALGREGGRA